MLIRQENKKDFDAVYYLIKEAFKSAEQSDGHEQDLVVALRKGDSFIPELSLVAEIEDEIIGHILFTEAKVENKTVLVLAPLSVHPKYQRQGSGKALIEAGHQIAKKLGYEYSFVLGSEDYYPKFRYVQATQFGLSVPEGIPEINFMGTQLQKNASTLNGELVYAKEFGL